MKRFIYSLAIIAFIVSSAFAAEVPLFRDNLDGKTLGQAVSITYAAGKTGQAAALDAPGDGILYPSTAFGRSAGRIEFDVCLTAPLSGDHSFWCLFSDVGAGGSHMGAINVHWRPGSRDMEYGIFDGSDHHWCTAKNLDWQPGEWHHVALVYGTEGMKLEVDGKLAESNEYSGGLSDTAKRLGFYDGYVQSPPVMVDNFETFRVFADSFELLDPVLSRNADGTLMKCRITYGAAAESSVTVKALKPDGTVGAVLLNESRIKPGDYAVSFDAKVLADGKYKVVCTIKSVGGTKELSAPLWVYKGTGRAPASFFSDFLPTGVWYFWEDDASYINRYVDDPKRAEDYYKRTIKDLADHGVNLIYANWTPHSRRKLLLDEAEKYGIKVIVHLDEINTQIVQRKPFDEMLATALEVTKGLKNHLAVAGYYLVDEPGTTPDVARSIAMAKKAVEIADPFHPGFSCLLGGYEDLLKTVGYRVLLVDIYPLGGGWNGDWSGYISEIERGMKNAGNRPLWVIMQTFGKPNSWKIPSPEEVRAQVWLALAYGAKGVVYFIYQSTTGIQGEWLQGVVDMDLKPMDGRWDELGKIDSDVRKLAPTILGLKPAEFDVPVADSSITARAFTDASGVRYAIVVNKDVKQSVAVKWTGALPTDVLTELRIRPLLVLKPGEGKLFKMVQ